MDRPDRHQINPDELRRLCRRGMSINKLAEHFGCSSRTIKRRIDRYKIQLPLSAAACTPARHRFTGTHVVPLAGPRFAPLMGWRSSGCTELCPGYGECCRRQELGLWPLCCVPTRHEVALAYRDGLIGFDGDMPEWLPGLVEELKVVGPQT